MVEAVTADSYRAISVAQLCRLAGISKRTFYEQFQNKQDCFLACYEEILGGVCEQVALAAEPHSEHAATLRGVFEELARMVVARPKAARLVLLDAPSVGPAALVSRDRARLELAQLLAACFAQRPQQEALPAFLTEAIVCGVERVMLRHLLDGGVGESVAIGQELAGWVLSYSSPVLPVLGQASVARNGRPAGRSCQASHHASERARMMRAAAEIVGSEGYTHLTTAKIARRAGVSKGSLHACYDSAEECFLDALDLLGMEVLMSATKASRNAEDGLTGVCQGVLTLMQHIAGDPVLRGVVFLEVFSVGSRAIERRERLLRGFADLLVRYTPRSLQLSWVTAEATVGAVLSVLNHHVLAGTDHVTPGLTANGAYTALAPLIGADIAIDAIVSEAKPGIARKPATTPAV